MTSHLYVYQQQHQKNTKNRRRLSTITWRIWFPIRSRRNGRYARQTPLVRNRKHTQLRVNQRWWILLFWREFFGCSVRADRYAWLEWGGGIISHDGVNELDWRRLGSCRRSRFHETRDERVLFCFLDSRWPESDRWEWRGWRHCRSWREWGVHSKVTEP